MTVASMAGLIGRQGEWLAPNGRMTFKVIVQDVRKVYNRVDYLVRPVAGQGASWVNAENVTLEEVSK